MTGEQMKSASEIFSNADMESIAARLFGTSDCYLESNIFKTNLFEAIMTDRGDKFIRIIA